MGHWFSYTYAKTALRIQCSWITITNKANGLCVTLQQQAAAITEPYINVTNAGNRDLRTQQQEVEVIYC